MTEQVEKKKECFPPVGSQHLGGVQGCFMSIWQCCFSYLLQGKVLRDVLFDFFPLLKNQKAQLCSSAVPVCAAEVQLVSANVRHGPDKTLVVRKPMELVV